MFATTTSQLMAQSKLFKALFGGSIAFIVIGTIMCSVFPFVNCGANVSLSCASYYTYFIYDCISGGTSYCCGNGYGTCGNYSYCIVKPYSYQGCVGLLIAGSTLLGLGGLLAIFVLVMFFNFRARVKRGAYFGMNYAPAQPIQPILQQKPNEPMMWY
jgi:hypothetical protein